MIHCSLCTIYVDNVLLKGHLFSAALPDMFGEVGGVGWSLSFGLQNARWPVACGFCAWCVTRPCFVFKVFMLFLGMLICSCCVGLQWPLGKGDREGRPHSPFRYVGAL